MSLENILDRANRIVDLFLKLEVHALALVAIGALICLHGNKDEGQLVIGGGLAVFKGSR